MTTLNLDAVGIKKAVIRSQHCQRNWDITKKIEAEMQRRKEATGAYTMEGVLRQLNEQLKNTEHWDSE